MNKKHSIWTEALIEQELTKLTSSLELDSPPEDRVVFDRDVENYEFWKMSNTKRKFHKYDSIDQLPKRKKVCHKKKRWKKIQHDFLNQPIKKQRDIIAHKLNEHKKDLIERVINTIGPEKAITFCNEALTIEDAGGLMVISGKRRRTPGGIFFHLLKTTAKLTKEELDRIFISEEIVKQRKRNKKKKKLKRLKNTCSSKMEGIEITDSSLTKKKVEMNQEEIKDKLIEETQHHQVY